MSVDPEHSERLRVVVTGGSGFIGTNLIEAYRRRGSAILNVDVAPPRNSAHTPFWRPCDITDAGSLREIFSSFQPDLVMHFAARTDLDEHRELSGYAANMEGVANVIGAIAAAGSVERSIFASSRLVFDLDYAPRHERDYHPSTLYGQSKAYGEELVRDAPASMGPWTIVRPTGIWGPWFGTPYRDFFRMIERGWYVHPGSRVVRKSFGYVENTVYQLQRLASSPLESVSGRTFWIADYPPVHVKAWAELIQDAVGASRIRTVPTPLLKGGALLGDVVERVGIRRFPLTTFRLNNMVTDMLYPTESLEALVGPLPYDLKLGVARTVEWLRQQF